MNFWKARWRSIRNAWEGLRYVYRTQVNARIHTVIALAVVGFAVLVKIGRLEWLILLIAICLVWAAEVFNTAVEKVVDFVSPEKQQFARICKDVSAAAVLITVLTAVVIGLVIFGPRLVRMIVMIRELFTG